MSDAFNSDLVAIVTAHATHPEEPVEAPDIEEQE